MKKKPIKKQKVTIEHLAELMCAHSAKIEKLTTIVEQNSHDVKDLQTSLDDLADSARKGFEEIDERFIAVDERFDKVEKRLDTVELKIDRIDERLVITEKVRYNTHETRLENIENTLRTVKTKLNIK